MSEENLEKLINEKTEVSFKKTKKKTIKEEVQKKGEAIQKEEDEDNLLNSFLKNFNFDNITLLDTEIDSAKIKENLNTLVLDTNPFKQVPLLQSCYTAYIKSASLSDLEQLIDIDASIHIVQENIYKVYYSLIVDSSIGKLSYEDFLRVTSIYDIETLAYGIYSRTFQSKQKLRIKCNNVIKDKTEKKICGAENNVESNVDSFIQITDEKVYEKIREVIGVNKKNSVDEMLKYSLVANVIRKKILDGKIIIELHSPNLKDHIDTLNLQVKYKELEKLNSSMNDLLVHTLRMYILNEKETVEKGKLTYNKVTNKEDIYSIYKENILPELAMEILDECFSFKTKYRIKYKTPEFKCSTCGKTIKSNTINIEEWLFQKVLEMMKITP